MPNPWFRLYSEILDDEKVQMMPFEDQRHLIMLFALRCQRDTSGMTNQQIAFRLRVDETLLKRLHETFLKHGFIEDDWTICNWNKRQFLSDSSTERVRRHRKNKALKQDETLQKQGETVFVTAPEQKQNRVDTEKTSPKQRKRRSEDGMIHSTDPRHIGCKEAIFEYYRSKNKGMNPPWDGEEGGALGKLLRADPQMTPDRMRQLLRNRFRSDAVHSDRPGRWIGRIHIYGNGPVDRFEKPMQTQESSKPKIQILSGPVGA